MGEGRGRGTSELVPGGPRSRSSSRLSFGRGLLQQNSNVRGRSQVNAMIAAHSTEVTGPPQRLDPAKGNVCFASAQHGWAFTAGSFAQVGGASGRSHWTIPLPCLYRPPSPPPPSRTAFVVLRASYPLRWIVLRGEGDWVHPLVVV